MCELSIPARPATTTIARSDLTGAAEAAVYITAECMPSTVGWLAG